MTEAPAMPGLPKEAKGRMPESKGRPGSAGQRPTGGDKAVATPEETIFPAQESMPFLRREDRR